MRFSATLLAAAMAAFVAGCAAPAAPANPSPQPPSVQPTVPPAAQPSAAPTRTAPTAPPGPTAAPSPAAAYPLVLKDDQGRQVTLARKPERVVTLQPSNTEILYALGLGDLHVAGSDFDDYPEAARSKPKLGGLQMSPEAIIAQRPDLVLATSGNAPSLLQQLEAARLSVLVLDANNLEGVYADILLVGKSAGAEDAARKLVAQLQQEVAVVKARTASVSRRPRVFHELDASDPAKLYTAGAGTFIDELISLAGGANIAASAPTQYPALSVEEVIRANPELITLGDAAYGTTPEQVAKRPGWQNIAAVKDGRVYPIDPDITSRPGPRIVEGLKAFAQIIQR
ncbi:MAG: cobalamin-binding protein [Chloroflexi bacterium]|nr:cobalamin-binding protein [Chloroflexota bacterium]